MCAWVCVGLWLEIIFILFGLELCVFLTFPHDESKTGVTSGRLVEVNAGVSLASACSNTTSQQCVSTAVCKHTPIQHMGYLTR